MNKIYNFSRDRNDLVMVSRDHRTVHAALIGSLGDLKAISVVRYLLGRACLKNRLSTALVGDLNHGISRFKKLFPLCRYRWQIFCFGGEIGLIAQ
jgi:hypothetical protein